VTVKARSRNQQSAPPPLWSERLYLRLAPEEIVRMKYLLEAWDHLGLQTTLDRYAAVIAVTYPPDRAKDMERFLDATAKVIPFTVLDVH
jgi:hypothetical protein